MASFYNGVFYSCNYFGDEALGKNKEEFAVSETAVVLGKAIHEQAFDML